MKRLAIVLVFCSLSVLFSGCHTAPKEALDLINKSITVTEGHAKDGSGEFSMLARHAFTADHDAWQKVRYMIYGVEVSEEVKRRTKERETKVRIRAIETNDRGGDE